MPGGLLATAHVLVGIVILVLVGWRVVLRATHGVPHPPDEEPLILRAVAALTHLALHAVLLVLPLSGLAAWYGGIGGAIDVHRLTESLLLAPVVLHVCGAFHQRFVLRSDVLARMRRPGLAQER